MKKLKVKGLSIGFEERGKGPAVVLLQGHEELDLLWDRESKILEQAGFRVIRLDLQASLDSASMLAGTLSEQVIALLNQLGVGRAVFVGWSKGGQVLQELVERFPKRVAKTVDLTRSCAPRLDAAGSRLVDFLQSLRQGSQVALA